MGEQAVGLLKKLGYTNVRHYIGGMAEWVENGGLAERSALPGTVKPAVPASRPGASRGFSWLETLASWSLERLVGLWLGMIVVFGVIYWLAGIGMGWGLQAGSTEVKPDLSGFATAIYLVSSPRFRSVTAT